MGAIVTLLVVAVAYWRAPQLRTLSLDPSRMQPMDALPPPVEEEFPPKSH
jgi:hypothetical protein